MTTYSNELAALRSENAALRAQLGLEPVAERPSMPSARGWGRATAAVALIVIGALLAPVAIVASWAGRELSDTDYFVATFSPLVRDPEVQRFITQQTTDAIEQQVNIPKLTGNVFDGVSALDLPPTAKSALEALRAPATAGIENLIDSTVQRFVASDQFANLWDALLRTGHTQLVATLSNNPAANVVIGSDGSVSVRLEPIIAAVKQQLVDRGVPFAARIPTVNRSVVVATSDTATRAQAAYGLLVATGAWLPWVGAAFVAAGIVVARRRNRALLVAALCVAAAMLLTLAALGIGRLVAVHRLAPMVMPANTVRGIYNQIFSFTASSAVAVLVLALCIAVTAWFGGGWGSARAVRGAAMRGISSLRRAGQTAGVTTGGFGVALARWRTTVRVLIAIAAAALIAFTRPLTPSVVIWTLVLALVATGLVELLSRPDSEPELT